MGGINDCSQVSGPGFFSSCKDCEHFIQCANGQTYEKNCPSGLHWDNNVKTCRDPGQANCQTAGQSTSAPAPVSQSMCLFVYICM